jgi:hypothetical protein
MSKECDATAQPWKEMLSELADTFEPKFKDNKKGRKIRRESKQVLSSLCPSCRSATESAFVQAVLRFA